MIIYVVTLNNRQSGERHLERVAFTNEDDAFDYCWKKIENILCPVMIMTIVQ